MEGSVLLFLTTVVRNFFKNITSISKYFILNFEISAFVLHKDFHVIIGTQREVISFYLLGIFKMNDLAIVVFDDADTTATTVMIKDQILNKLPANCQKVFIASNKMRPLIDNLVEMKFFVDDNVFPHNIDNYFVECASNRKYEVIKALCVEANNDRANGKIIIFFTVRFAVFSCTTCIY